MEQNKEKELPIGFMDSGLGGISVLKAAVQIMGIPKTRHMA